VGRTVDFLPYFLYVVQAPGQHGLDRDRVPYQLSVVTDANTPDRMTLYCAAAGMVADQVRGITAEALLPAIVSSVPYLRLEFLAPLRLKKIWRLLGRHPETYLCALCLDALLVSESRAKTGRRTP
jgi:hypothetical protein